MRTKVPETGTQDDVLSSEVSEERNTIHREVNPASEPTHALVIRVGEGEPVVNVPRPQS